MSIIKNYLIKYSLLKTLLLIIIYTAQLSCKSQEILCYTAIDNDREVFELLSGLELCPAMSEREIFRVVKDSDFDGNNSKDLILYSLPTHNQVGSEIGVHVFLSNKDGEFTFFKSYYNLLPLYFEDYTIESIVKLPVELSSLYPYEGVNPIRMLRFGDATIQMSATVISDFYFEVEFKLDNERKKYYITKALFLGNNSFSPQNLQQLIGLPIDSFNIDVFFNWEP